LKATAANSAKQNNVEKHVNMYTQAQLLTIYKLLKAINEVGNMIAETGKSRQHIRDVFYTHGVAAKHPDIVNSAISKIKASGILADIQTLTEILN